MRVLVGQVLVPFPFRWAFIGSEPPVRTGGSSTSVGADILIPPKPSSGLLAAILVRLTNQLQNRLTRICLPQELAEIVTL